MVSGPWPVSQQSFASPSHPFLIFCSLAVASECTWTPHPTLLLVIQIAVPVVRLCLLYTCFHSLALAGPSILPVSTMCRCPQAPRYLEAVHRFHFTPRLQIMVTAISKIQSSLFQGSSLILQNPLPMSPRCPPEHLLYSVEKSTLQICHPPRLLDGRKESCFPLYLWDLLL